MWRDDDDDDVGLMDLEQEVPLILLCTSLHYRIADISLNDS